MLSDMMTFAGPLWRGHAGDMTLDAGALLNATSTLVLPAPAPEHVHTPAATITTPAPQIRSQLTCLVCWSLAEIIAMLITVCTKAGAIVVLACAPQCVEQY